MKLYRRENYLNKIRGFYNDTGMIKVISGVRRCGKSSLMHTIAEELAESGVAQENIIFLDLRKRGFRNIKTPEQLEAAIDQYGTASGIKYLFIDEIQNVSGFEPVVEEYRLEDEYSIFITGSNSYLLSGELATELTGRYIEFEMFTLTFEEYLKMKEFYGIPADPDLTKELDSYILEGGFPKALEYRNISDKRRYVDSVIQEIYKKDISSKKKINNKEVFFKVMNYLINNFGAPVSITNLLDELHKAGITVKRETLTRYIQILLDAKILYECKRFDLKTKKSINGEQKYYLADLSFYFVNNTDNRINYGPVLENIIFQYAKSKGYKVSVGRIGKLECDFIIRDSEMNYAYIQVAMTIMNSIETENREYRPFELIRDGYPKYLLTRNDLIQKRNGVKHLNIPDFIKDGKVFE
ncbi:MAG: ATP-binding protein [Solobacterium sp.]|nr:ATP-binding protein [Solobacterium sp.]